MKTKRNKGGIVEPRSFNEIKVYPTSGTLYKKSENAEALEAEKSWYRELPPELQFIHPRIFALEQPGSIIMEYLDYPTAHELYMGGATDTPSAIEWLRIFEATKVTTDTLAGESYTIDIDPVESHELIKTMYIEKTEKRLNELAENRLFKAMYLFDVEINGKRYISISEMIDTIKRHAWMELGNIDRAPIIHGDLHLGNMLVHSSGNGVKLIDPRGKFGSHVLHGDARYDTAKLMHSIEGKYDLIIEDEFESTIDLEERSIRYSFDRKWRRRSRAIEWAFAQVYGEKISEDRRALTIIEALLFLSMIPLHTESAPRQFVMLARGYELMEKAMGSAYVSA